MSSIFEEIKPETAELIAAQAKARGLSVDDYLRSLLPEDAEQAQSPPLYETAKPEELASAFAQWVKDHAVKGIIADDSRENIYSREDEAL
ncbi:MAG TPA: hypothetical protein VNN73_01840 [Blastocatellia bacterium]|nr:hypothetical protein [Blastocatellia bacterium]